jgi:hypothetical protein
MAASDFVGFFILAYADRVLGHPQLFYANQYKEICYKKNSYLRIFHGA